MTTGLTTHVLDTMHGHAASGLGVRLRRDGEIVTSAITNIHGRTDKPLLSAKAMTNGLYRLEYDIGEYFRDLGVTLPTPAFLETLIVEFGISDADKSHDIALQVSPFAYSAHRSA